MKTLLGILALAGAVVGSVLRRENIVMSHASFGFDEDDEL